MADRQAIGLGHLVRVVGPDEKARPGHVFHDDNRISRDVLAHVTGNRAGISIIATSSRGPHDDADRLTLVERFLPKGRSSSESDKKSYEQRQLLEHGPSRVIAGYTRR